MGCGSEPQAQEATMPIGFTVPRAAVHLACALALTLIGCGAPVDDNGAVGEESGQCVGGPKFDPAGAKNVGNGHGVQFIGGQCLSAADCASGCCALPCGICSGPGAQFQAGKQGCGFDHGGSKTGGNTGGGNTTGGNTGGNTNQCVGGPAFDPAGAKNVGNGHGVQFIGGQCLSAADCASGCCALPCGICSGPGAQFQAGKQGCGFGGTQAPPAQQPPPQTTPPPANNGQCVGGPAFDPAGEKNVGNGHGVQFIGGQCLNAKDCASGCCALPCGICSGPGAQFQAGKQGCGFGG
jgi:hypothetical protein